MVQSKGNEFDPMDIMLGLKKSDIWVITKNGKPLNSEFRKFIDLNSKKSNTWEVGIKFD